MIEPLSGYRLMSAARREDRFDVELETVGKPRRCPNCGGKHLRGFGRRTKRLADVPLQGKPVTLVISRQRFQCVDCGDVSLEKLPHRAAGRNATTRLIQHVKREAKKLPFTVVAKAIGLNEKTVRNIVRG